MCLGPIKRKHRDHAMARKIVVEDNGIDIEGELQRRCIEMVKEGIAAERENCAKIAEGYTDGTYAAIAIRGEE